MKLSETLVSLALLLLVMSGVVTLVLHTVRLTRTHPDRFELQQRARVALDLVTRDLRSAGAGVDRGPATGPLAPAIPAIWPRRLGRAGDAPTLARPDVVTLLAVPDTLAQTTTATGLAPSSPAVDVEAAAHCPPARPACGFSADTTVGVLDPAGVFSLWTTESVIGQTLTLRPLALPSAAAGPGAVATELLVRGYRHDPATRQLRYFDGDATNQPIIDGVTGWSLRYFDDRGELPIASFMDGPWVGSGDTMFDVDLLRIRRVRVDLAVAAGRETYRAVVEVAPRNLAHAGGPW